ncbi:MAG: Uncharacterized protein Athens101410_778 [Parcubacteria group bacterium Athens1014_10]|nr:MAG: Uncharacterized protein Athens101410_778 [Parcubacteria group bacterium Athens1014_10]
MKTINIFPTITTTEGSNWEEKIEEAKNLGIKEICIFPTCLDGGERKKMYQALKKTKIQKIPLVHLRSDMKLEELDFFIKNYQTEVFNIHSQFERPLVYNLSKYKDKIYIENTFGLWREEEIKKFAGICIDFSHLENDRLLKRKQYTRNIKFIKKYICGCGHISVVKKFPYYGQNLKENRYDFHYLDDLAELDYLKKYPMNYFPSVIAIELENSIKEQIKIKKYILEQLKRKI